MLEQKQRRLGGLNHKNLFLQVESGKWELRVASWLGFGDSPAPEASSFCSLAWMENIGTSCVSSYQPICEGSAPKTNHLP